MRIYLSGPLADCTESEIYGWRSEVAQILEPLGYEFTNTTLRIWQGETTKESCQNIVEMDKLEIDHADILLVNYTKVLCGTAQEVIYAWERSKIVITVFAGAPDNPWMRYHSDTCFNNLNEVIRLLQFAAQHQLDKTGLKKLIQEQL